MLLIILWVSWSARIRSSLSFVFHRMQLLAANFSMEYLKENLSGKLRHGCLIYIIQWFINKKLEYDLFKNTIFSYYEEKTCIQSLDKIFTIFKAGKENVGQSTYSEILSIKFQRQRQPSRATYAYSYLE